MRQLIRFLALAFSLISVAAFARYPDRPVTIVVPYNPGGGADPIARKVAQALEKKLGGNFVVENRPGASGIIGEGYVAKAPADGYTLLYDATPFSINPHLFKVPFRPDDFEPIVGVLRAPQMVLVPPDSPIKTIGELVADAKAHPGKLTYGSGGGGTVQRLSAELLRQGLNLDMLHVPYKSGTNSVVALMGNQIDWCVAGMTANYTLVTSNKIRAIAVTSAKRSPLLPDVPTVSESGVPGYETYEWNGLLAPAGTPPEVVSKIQNAVLELLKEKEINDYLAARGVIPMPIDAKEFAEFLRKESKKWAEVIDKGNIQQS
ncbi:Bug family tripartite tricarboxylate transporter substrate binding protein [Candidimonas nitroreducens]|uniref:LacI family transcriptional regulator n=1 Tax=Candidimonas nitroreducens TaxID=683354 RepID=A0A225MFB7_9BURK|nr:tripartite tricarboxylate transporter substrate binding protein [Candidimonas nitroreducens]OWT58953.1 LacI family transcriptional regulator [Candidimonas nitroreducens]